MEDFHDLTREDLQVIQHAAETGRPLREAESDFAAPTVAMIEVAEAAARTIALPLEEKPQFFAFREPPREVTIKGRTLPVLEVKSRKPGESLVCKVQHPQTGRNLAYKAYAPAFFNHAQNQMVSLTALGGYANIIRLMEWERTDEVFALLLEYVGEEEGYTSLLQALQGAKKERNPFSEETVARLVGGIARSLIRVRDIGWIYRDVKPGNVVVYRDGTPRLLDFDVIAPLPKKLSLAQGFEGTYYFTGLDGLVLEKDRSGSDRRRLQPAINQAEIGPRYDVYGLGALAYALLALKVPHTHTAEEKRRAAELQGLEAIDHLRKALIPKVLGEPVDYTGVPPKMKTLLGRMLVAPRRRISLEETVAYLRDTYRLRV